MSERREAEEKKILFHLHHVAADFGYPMSVATGLRGGRLYPALTRLEQQGRIVSGWSDGPEPRRRWYMLVRGKPLPRCAHCGFPQRGSASLDGQPLCHPDEDAYPDCYRLVTVYGEPLGLRRVDP